MNIFRLKRKSKKINLKRYLLLIFSLIMTTFAWFAYSKILETDIALDLLPWDIKFFIGEVEKFNPIDIVMQDLYPGMEDRTVDVVIQNNGRVEAGVQFQVNEVTLLGDTYNLVSDANAELGEDDLYLPSATIENGVLSQYVINDPERFPFTVYIASVTRVAPVSEGILTIRISWPGDNDELDTKWGYDVAQFYNSGAPVGQPLKISLQIDVTQNQFTYASPITLFDREGENEEGLHIGDFVEYDAGTWTQAEIDAIQTGLKTSLVTANGSTDFPTEAFQFGGFKAGDSRGGNATPYNSSYNYVKDALTNTALTGWRVFDIADDGSVTLISAGNPEDYSHSNGTNYGYISEYILTGQVNSNWSTSEANNYTKRNWNNYINTSQNAESATVLTKSRLDSWYSKYIVANTDTNTQSIFKMIYDRPEYQKYQNMVENYSYYWLSEASYSYDVYVVNPRYHHVYSAFDRGFGVRVLVTLSSDVEFTTRRTATKTVTGGNMDTYGGNQTYNVWGIKPEETIREPEYVTADKIFDSEGTNADGLHIGDFVNYDAGTWTESEINEIQVGPKTDLVQATGSTSLAGMKAFQFGGFTAGSSRNGNATYNISWGDYDYVKDKSTGEAITGWRVFDIEEDGRVTLISAGNPEDYYHIDGAYASEYILTGQETNSESSTYQKRDWSNYINTSQKGESATVLTKSRLDNWYSKYIVANANIYTGATFQMIYSDPYAKYQNMVENYSFYWLSEAYNDNKVCYTVPRDRYVGSGASNALGLRVLVTLSPDAKFTSQKAGTKTITGGNMNTYGGDQTYNVWGLKTESDTSGGSGSGSGGSDSGGPYMPTGFSLVAEATATNGYTIKDSSGNQYVWVEVPQDLYENASYNTDTTTGDKKPTSSTDYDNIEFCLKKYTNTYRNGTSYKDEYYSDETTGLTSTKYTEYKQKMLKSVYENGGFYVGKYETGTATARESGSSTTAPTNTPIIQQNAYPYNFVTCSQAQTLASSMESGGYTTSLMFGIQWDLMLKYIEIKEAATEAELNENSTEIGNYYNNAYNITNTLSKHYSNKSGSYKWTSGAYGSKAASKSVLLSTGASEDFNLMGIYDIAGNIEEWTLEYTSMSNGPCVRRGGYYYNNGSYLPASKRNNGSTSRTGRDDGFRSALY